MDTITGRITGTRRMLNRKDGGPVYQIELTTPAGETHTYRTASDAALAHEIENSEYREHDHTFELDRGRLARVRRD